MLYILGVDSGKQAIMASLAVQSPEKPNYCHFPINPGLGFDATYLSQLLSEHLTYQPKRKNPWIWEKIPGHERNEALDCMNYANAAFKATSPDLDAIEHRIKELREGKTKPIKTKQRTKQPRRNNANKFFDSW